MYISPKASRIRQREAQRARDNSSEIRKALSWVRSPGAISSSGALHRCGALALKNGLSPFARSAFAAVPTGMPRSPLFGTARSSASGCRG